MKTQLILVLNLIGLVGGVTFWDQSQSEVKQNQTKPIQPWLDFHSQLKISVQDKVEVSVSAKVFSRMSPISTSYHNSGES